MRRSLSPILFLILLSCGGPPSGDETPVAFSVRSVAVEGLIPSAEFAPTLDGPLRAVAFSPVGSSNGSRALEHLSVTFSRPMVPLGDAPPPEAGSFRIDPDVPGSLSWAGSRTLVFTPAAPLPEASSFQVSVSDLVAAGGAPLEEPVIWSFETARPAIARTAPSAGDRFWPEDLPLRVHFNQAVALSDAPTFIRLTTDGGARVPARVEADGDSAAVLVPSSPLMADRAYQFHIRAGLPSATGPLGLAKDLTIPFRVLGPLRLESIEQERPWWDDSDGPFRPDRAVRITFSNPVFRDSLLSSLTLTPPVDWLAENESAGLPPSTVHTLRGPWAPQTRYQVVLDTLVDSFGQELEHASQAFLTGVLPPSFSMATGVMYLEAGRMKEVPLRTTGIARVRASRRAVGPDELFGVLRAYDDGHWYGPLPEGAPEPSRQAPDQDIGFSVSAGERLVSDLDLGVDSTGVVVFQVDVPETRGYEGRTQFAGVAVVTNLALTAKFSPHESLAAVTRVSDASPVAGADIEVRDGAGTVHWRGVTGGDGSAEFPGWASLGIEPISNWDRPVLHVVARVGTDWTFISSPFQDGIEPYRFNVPYQWLPEPASVAGSVFSDRGLYRSGDTVYLKGIMRSRTSGDWSVISDSLRILVRSPRDEVVMNRVVETSPLGTFDLDWVSTDRAAQGTYVVRVAFARDSLALKREPWERGDLATSTFRLESFRAATFSVEAGSLQEDYIAGDVFEGTVEGRYLFGAEMRRAPVRATLQRRNGAFRPPGLDGFDFDQYWDRNDYGIYETLIEADTLLSDSGRLVRRWNLPGHPGGRPTLLEWEAAVQSPDGQEQVGRSRLTLHPALYYLGVKPSTAFIDLGRTGRMSADIVSVTPAGAATAATAVRVELIRREWNSVREIGWDGRARWRSESSEILIAAEEIDLDAGRAARLDFQIPQAGSYVVRATGYDIRGNLTSSESPIWASGQGYVSWRRSDDDLLDLVADKDHYRPGETARILVPSPFEEAMALITVERDGVMQHEVRQLSGSAPQIEIPVTEEFLPNVFVGVVLLSGRSAEPALGGDVGAPAFRAGYVQLPVSADSRRLSVEMTTSADTLRPGAPVTVRFRLTDPRGRGIPGEIAFSAADAGVVDLIGYRLPDPFDAFYGTRPLNVTTAETRAHLVRQRSFGQKEEDAGGGGGDPDFLLRRDFRAQAHWEPSIQTDQAGRAQIEFNLPESLTKFRLMASAVGAGHRFGASQTTVVTTLPLVLQPAIPRFARAGDEFEAGVLVSNRTRQEGEARITVSGGGMVFEDTTSVRVLVAAGETRRVAFPGLTGATGDARMVFEATMGSEVDALEVTIPVLESLTRVRSGLFASTGGSVVESLRFPASRTPGRGSLDVTIASTALVGLDGAVQYLFEYPYGCLEQRTSRIKPVLVAGDLLETFQLEALGGDGRDLVASWLSDLDQFWTGTGFSLWPGGQYNHPYVTAYVLATLVDAREAGFAIDSRRFSEITDAVERSVRNASDRPGYLPEVAWRDSRAFMLLALTRAGRYLETESAALADEYLADPAPSISGIAHVVRALSLQDRLGPRRDALTELVKRRIRVEADGAFALGGAAPGYSWIFSSDTRASASALATLAVQGTDRTLAEQLVRGLIERRPVGHWSTTQDNAAVVDGLVAYRDAFEGDDPDLVAAVSLAGTEILSASFEGPSLATASTRVGTGNVPDESTLTFQKTGDGRLFYSALLETYVATPPGPASNGLRITRTIEPLDRAGRQAGPQVQADTPGLTFTTGDLVRVTLRLESSTDRNYIVVDDPLPAGLEPVNSDFASAQSGLADLTGSGQWWGSFNHTELRDDRVLLFADYLRPGEHTYRYLARAGAPGTYAWPGTQAEAMYRPAINARGASGRLTVQAPQ
jgi:alpha-2-macroglobulin